MNDSVNNASNIILYHGSRGGIVGGIEPKSRVRCDFGKGFYMGTNPEQAKTLVSNDQAPFFYKLKLDISTIPQERILRLDGMDWAYFVLFNRGRLDDVKKSDLYKSCRHLADNKDLIIGPIADDAMNDVMTRFIHGDITDKAFLECIRGLDYGIQYVAKTKLACNCIEIISEKELFGKELDDAVRLSGLRRQEGRSMADTMQLKYRREGNYFDEILETVRIKGDPGKHL